MKPFRSSSRHLFRGPSSAPSAGGAPDADAVIKVVFESARRSGVDLPSSAGASLGSLGSGGGNLVMSSSSSLAADAAKRQAREYALRVQRFREHQKKAAVVSPASAAAAASGTDPLSARFTLDVPEDAEDPLAGLFSDIESPRVQRMTRPLTPSRPVPSLFETKKQPSSAAVAAADGATKEAGDAAVALPPIRQRKDRPPSPTRKASPLRKPAAPSIPGGGSSASQTVMMPPRKKSPLESQPSLQLHVPGIAPPTPTTTTAAATPVAPGQHPHHEAQRLSDMAPAERARLDQRRKAAEELLRSTTQAQQKQQQQQQVPESAADLAASIQFEAAARPSLQTHDEAAAVAATTTTAFSPSFVVDEEQQRRRVAELQRKLAAEKREREAAAAANAAAGASSSFAKTAAAQEERQRAEQLSREQREAAAAPQADVEQWSALRAKALEDLNAEREAQAAAEAAEHAAKVDRAKIDAWIESRQRPEPVDPLTHFAGKVPAIREMHDLYVAPTWDRAFAAFAAVQRHESTSAETLGSALALAAVHTLRWAEDRKQHVRPAFEAILHGTAAAASKSGKSAAAAAASSAASSSSSAAAALAAGGGGIARMLAPSMRNTIEMTVMPTGKAEERFAALSDGDRALLPRFLFERHCAPYLRGLLMSGAWEGALGFIQRMKPLRNDPFLRAEAALLSLLSNRRIMSDNELFEGAAFQSEQRRAVRQRYVNIVGAIEQQCRAKLSQLGRGHARALMLAYGRLRCFGDVRRIYAEMGERGELDEEIAAAFLRYSTTATIEATIPELRKAGINVLSGACTRAIVYSMLGRGEDASALETLRAFQTVTPPAEWTLFEMRAAVAVCMNSRTRAERVALERAGKIEGGGADASPASEIRAAFAAMLPAERTALEASLPPADAGMVDTIYAAIMAEHQRNAGRPHAEMDGGGTVDVRVLSFLITALSGHGRIQQLLEIGRAICTPGARINDELSEQAFAALNAALATAGVAVLAVSPQRAARLAEREAARISRLSDAERRRQEQQQKQATAAAAATTTKSSAQQQQQQQQSATSIPSGISERMLEFGRTRSWAEALQLLHSVEVVAAGLAKAAAAESPVPLVPAPLVSTVTLLYNCAISAAVDRVEIAQDIADEMRRLGVQPNATTNNTMMTALGKTEDRWHEALEIFARTSTNAAARDASTYSVALSVLGKRGQWQTAVQVFQDMRKQPGMTKPSPVAFGLLVQAAHKESWVVTLRAFQEMTKLHGTAAAKEQIVARVVSSLDAAGRTGESTRLLESLRKKK